MQKPTFTLRFITQFYRLTGLRESRNLAWWNGTSPYQRPPEFLNKNLHVNEDTILDRAVWTIRSQDKSTSGSILFIHGNGFRRGMSKGHWKFVQKMAEQTGQTIIVPNFPLLPEADPNRVLTFLDTVFDKLSKDHDSESITLFADSSGGAIAHSFCQMRIRDHKSQPDQLILLNPWLDLTFSNPLIDEIETQDPILSRAIVREHAKAYYGAFDPTDPLVSPVYGNIRRICPTSVFIGTNDICYPDTRKLKLKADSEPVVFQFRAFEGLFHNWPMHRFSINEEATAMIISHIIHPPSEAELSMDEDRNFWKN